MFAFGFPLEVGVGNSIAGSHLFKVSPSMFGPQKLISPHFGVLLVGPVHVSWATHVALNQTAEASRRVVHVSTHRPGPSWSSENFGATWPADQAPSSLRGPQRAAPRAPARGGRRLRGPETRSVTR